MLTKVRIQRKAPSYRPLDPDFRQDDGRDLMTEGRWLQLQPQIQLRPSAAAQPDGGNCPKNRACIL